MTTIDDLPPPITDVAKPRSKLKWDVNLRFRDIYISFQLLFLFNAAVNVIPAPDKIDATLYFGTIAIIGPPFFAAGWFLWACFIAWLGRWIYDPALRYLKGS
jgi:hypothetical protein